MAQESGKKSKTAQREDKILSFWQERDIFQKSLQKPSPKGEFVFYDGPPFATGLPHYGSLLSSVVKDVIPRFKTMQGYHVRRRWGWDCHGLPIENMIEKELGLKTKKEIEKIGIDTFNEACRSSVLRYADAWKKYIDRIGRWVEYDNAYKTMDNTYMESVWWSLKQMHSKKLLYEGRKVLLYCPHCETPLARAEIQQDNSYKDITEEATTVKFKVKEPQKHGFPENTYFLAWTTTPWTLPGNIALAVGQKIKYVLIEKGEEHHILAKELAPEDAEFEEKMSGETLLGIDYEPLFEIEKVVETGKRSWYVTDGDFVTTEEGTGIVHTAVIYGEDDYALGLRKDFAMVPLLDASGHFNDSAPSFLQGVYFKKAEKMITSDLEERGLLFSKSDYTHSYPHCHRCDTPLIYNAITSWFINIQKAKQKLLQLNEKVSWFPGHLKHGRFLNILKEAPDWTISRNRYWASPLPIWKCIKCEKIKVIESVKELKKSAKKSGNSYFLIRHGQSQGNTRDLVSAQADNSDHLTELGMQQVIKVAKRLHKQDVDLIISSPFVRTHETAKIIHEHLGLKQEQLILDGRIGEFSPGDEFEGKTWQEYLDRFSTKEQFEKSGTNGETRLDIKRRVGEVLYEMDKKYNGKHILIVTHEGVADAFDAVAESADRERSVTIARNLFLQNAEIRKLAFTPMPHNKDYELDLHRPYIDSITLSCSCGEDMERIPEVVDGWVESGSMPFAEYHYPFENKRVFKKRSPGDFVAEYVAQTRTWFYYMHAISGILFGKQPFKNVVTTGNILAEDGSKMSKSKGNYTDPLENLNLYGADALRYYLMDSTVMQGEDVRFLNDELREAHNRVVNILSNVLSFYELYSDDKDNKVRESSAENILDKWILLRLSELINDVTKYLENYDTVRASKTIRDFIEDFSTWYIRRSRERFKSEDKSDRKSAMATTRFVLFETARIIAPLMPFLAEDIYQKIRGGHMQESVHLESWPKTRKLSKEDKELIKNMETVRVAVSHGLEARARMGIKVRQPLGKLSISMQIPEEYQYLVRDEVNVKEIKIDTEMIERVQLDTNITEELREEGNLRDLIRHIQRLRKEMKLEPNHPATLFVGAREGDKSFVEKFEDDIKSSTSLEKIVFDTSTVGAEIKISERRFSLSIKK